MVMGAPVEVGRWLPGDASQVTLTSESASHLSQQEAGHIRRNREDVQLVEKPDIAKKATS
jgi:hypothetical protein